MNFTIKSRKTGEIFSFTHPKVVAMFTESQGHSGNSGAQICRGEGLWAVRCTVTLLRTILPVLPVNGTDSS